MINSDSIFYMLVDLRDRGFTHCDVARKIGVPRTRVRDWYAGSMPRLDDGLLLISLWLANVNNNRLY